MALSELPQHFSDFFHSKVTSIRRKLDLTTVTPPSVPDQPFCGTAWGAFQSVSEDEVKKLLKQSRVKTAELDSQPTSALTHCLEDLFPHLTSIINDSMHFGLFESAFKSAIVKPQLKKITLNPEILKNYRPVSNLSFLSKFPWESCSPPALGPSVDQQSSPFLHGKSFREEQIMFISDQYMLHWTAVGRRLTVRVRVRVSIQVVRVGIEGSGGARMVSDGVERMFS